MDELDKIAKPKPKPGLDPIILAYAIMAICGALVGAGVVGLIWALS